MACEGLCLAMVIHLLRWSWLAAHLPLFSTNLHQMGVHGPLLTTLACPYVQPSVGSLTAAGLSLLRAPCHAPSPLPTGKAVGFRLVTSLDLATASSVAKPWYGRLEELAWQNQVRGGRASARGARPLEGLLVVGGFLGRCRETPGRGHAGRAVQGLCEARKGTVERWPVSRGQPGSG